MEIGQFKLTPSIRVTLVVAHMVLSAVAVLQGNWVMCGVTLYFAAKLVSEFRKS